MEKQKDFLIALLKVTLITFLIGIISLLVNAVLDIQHYKESYYIIIAAILGVIIYLFDKKIFIPLFKKHDLNWTARYLDFAEVNIYNLFSTLSLFWTLLVLVFYTVHVSNDMVTNGIISSLITHSGLLVLSLIGYILFIILWFVLAVKRPANNQ